MRLAKTVRSSSTGSTKVGLVLRLTPFHGIAVFNSAVGDVGLRIRVKITRSVSQRHHSRSWKSVHHTRYYLEKVRRLTRDEFTKALIGEMIKMPVVRMFNPDGQLFIWPGKD